MDVLTTCAYGIQTDALNHPDHPIVVNARKALSFNASISTIFCVLFPSLAKKLDLYLVDKNAVKFFESLTKRIYQERKKQNEPRKRNGFLQLMIDAEEESEKEKSESASRKMSMDELIAQGILFFIAGYDTTGATLSHCFYYLAKNPECQEKLYEELSSLEKVDVDTLAELKYLDAVIQETLRIAPPFTLVERTCIEDHQLGDTGITIKAGTTVSFDAYGLQHDPQHFEDPESFKPERFIGEATHHPYAFITFGGGPRLCLGMRFAMNEIRMCLAKVIKDFRFKLAPDAKVTKMFLFYDN